MDIKQLIVSRQSLYTPPVSQHDNYTGNIAVALTTYPTWAQTHDAANGSHVNNPSSPWMAVSKASPTLWNVTRGFIGFDTSFIGAGKTVYEAVLAMTPDSGYANSEADLGYAKTHIVEGVQVSGLAASDYGNHLAKVLSGGEISFSSLIEDVEARITLNSDGRGWINKTGITKLCLRAAADLNNDEPTGINVVSWKSPRLLVVYS